MNHITTSKSTLMHKLFSLRIKVIVFGLPWLLLIGCQTQQKQQAVASPERPNILWLVAEDISPYLPAFGDSTIVTPNISRLAAEGVRYTHVFSPSGVCAPTRAAIATGMYPTSIGAGHMRTNQFMEVTGLPAYEAVPPPQVKMFSELLRKEGYYCSNNSKEDYQFKAPVTAWDESSNTAHWRNRKEGQPFFSIFNFFVTHESQLFEPYERQFIIPDSIKVTVPPYLPDTPTVRHDLKKLYNNIAHLDRQVGEILDQLREDGLLEKTIIFFYSDHGGPLPRQKRMVYDSGLRVPMIVRYPDQEDAGTIDDQLISFIDFAPTVLTLAGENPPDYLQGQTFAGDSTQRSYIHGAADRFDGFTDAKRAVRDQRFKYLRNYRPEQGYYLPVTFRELMPSMQELLRLRDSGELNEAQAQWFRKTKPKEELFDCVNDPHELHNLVEDPKYAEKLAELRTEMDRWLTAIGDRPNYPEPQLISELWNSADEQPKTAIPLVTKKDGKLTLSCATEGASIGYRFVQKDSLETPWQVYQKPIVLEADSQLQLQAHRIGFLASDVISYR